VEYGRRVSCKSEKNKHLKKIWLFSIRKWELGFQRSSCPIFKTKNIFTRQNSLVNFHVNVVVYFHIMFKAPIVDLYVVNRIEPQWTPFKLDIIYIIPNPWILKCDLPQSCCNSTYNYVVASFHGHLCKKSHLATLAHDVLHVLVSSLQNKIWFKFIIRLCFGMLWKLLR
jgi:hypothetical protein